MKIFLSALIIFFVLNFSSASAAAETTESLIAKYERDLDIYNFDKKINLQDMMSTAEKLAALDANNVSAFRAKVFVYRQQDNPNQFYNYCYEVLKKSNSFELLIEAYLQMGNYDFISGTVEQSREYVDNAIKLVKEKYSKTQIEEFVNGTDVQVVDFKLTGRSNTIRELYILKSEIENCNPQFDSETIMIDLELKEYKFYNIKYRTDW